MSLKKILNILPMFSVAELRKRFSFHPATEEIIIKKHEQVREKCYELALWMDNNIPNGREKTLVITKLEEVMYWANASVAREGHNYLQDAPKED